MPSISVLRLTLPWVVYPSLDYPCQPKERIRFMTLSKQYLEKLNSLATDWLVMWSSVKAVIVKVTAVCPSLAQVYGMPFGSLDPSGWWLALHADKIRGGSLFPFLGHYFTCRLRLDQMDLRFVRKVRKAYFTPTGLRGFGEPFSSESYRLVASQQL